MKTSIIDLRYKMKDVIKALEKREKITILYHGKPKGVILPVHMEKKKDVKTHPFFGMFKEESKSVEETMQELRGGRYRAF